MADRNKLTCTFCEGPARIIAISPIGLLVACDNCHHADFLSNYPTSDSAASPAYSSATQPGHSSPHRLRPGCVILSIL